jgi:hypothetical protein
MQTEFMTAWGIKQSDKAMFPFLAKQQLWTHDKDVTVDFNDDWFGEAVLRPDIVLKDLKSIVTPASNAQHNRTFFRNIFKGEQQTTADGGACKNLQCDSYSKQIALPVATAASSSKTPPGSGGTVAAPVGIGFVVAFVAVVLVVA